MQRSRPEKSVPSRRRWRRVSVVLVHTGVGTCAGRFGDFSKADLNEVSMSACLGLFWHRDELVYALARRCEVHPFGLCLAVRARHESAVRHCQTIRWSQTLVTLSVTVSILTV